MPDYDLEKFINREYEIALVVDRVSDLANGKPFEQKERVFHFVGPSGIGKSCLLEQICKRLDEKYPNCPLFLLQLDALQSNASGLVDGLLIKVYEAFCRHKNIVPKSCVGQKRKIITSYIHRLLEMFEKDQVIVLLLDEVNIPAQIDMQEIEESLVLKFLNAKPRGVLVTAGRSHAKWTNYTLVSRPSKLPNTYHLPAFDEEKTCEQMESLKPGSKKLAGKIHKLGSGVPGNTVKLMQHIMDPPLDILELPAVQALLDDIKVTNKIDKRYIPILEALSILQGFFPEDVVALFQCHPQINGMVWDERKVKQEFLKLKDIQIGPGGLIDWDRDKKHWAMDERTRDLFERELQMRDVELWVKLHCTAMKMYGEWGAKPNSNAYRIKSEHHQNCLQAGGMHCSNLEG